MIGRQLNQMAVTEVGQGAATYAVVPGGFALHQLRCILGSNLNLDLQHPEQHVCLWPETHIPP